MKLQKYYDREKFTWSEKKEIANKSDDKCCHCGALSFFTTPGHTKHLATVDHVIPIIRGGSNRMHNLIMLCEDCNKEKDRKIMPIEWFPYLKEEFKAPLKEYMENYLQAMNTERTHLLSYDEYTFAIDQKILMGYRKHSKMPTLKINVKMKRANQDDDFDKLVDYLSRYLKKYDALDGIDAVEMNIAFWMTFGSIYYVEKNGEITCMVAITMKHVTGIEGYHGIDVVPYMYFFPYYATDQSTWMVYDMIRLIPEYICKEKGLTIMPVSALLLADDKMNGKLSTMAKSIVADISNFREYMIVINTTNEDLDLSIIHKTFEEMTEEEKKTYKFTSQFKDLNESLVNYFKKYSGVDEITWMINCLVSYAVVKDTELGQILRDSDQAIRE